MKGCPNLGGFENLRGFIGKAFMDISNSTLRFSNRVENYLKYRPTYPKQIISLLKEQCGLSSKTVIADVGSGTGLLTKLLLENGNLVFGIEPNKNMREAAEELLSKYENFTSINATAENTTLKSQSIDLITVGQAFHWFDAEKSKSEFKRILRFPSCIVLIWNERLVDRSPFLRVYETLLQKYAIDYGSVDHRNVSDEDIGRFFSPYKFELATFPNSQKFNFTGLKGRLLSSSYIPNTQHSQYLPMLSELNQLFEEHNIGGKVVIEYQTKVYYGQINA